MNCLTRRIILTALACATSALLNIPALAAGTQAVGGALPDVLSSGRNQSVSTRHNVANPPYRASSLPLPSALSISPTTAGIDLSWANQVDSFHQVSDAGIKFVILKATEGESIQDTNFAGYRNRAESVGLPVGVYHLISPGANSASQLKNYLAVLGTIRANEKVCLIDVEPDSNWLALSAVTRIDRILNFAYNCKRATGQDPEFYVSPDVLGTYIVDPTPLVQYPLWLAEYNTDAAPYVPQPFKNWTFWQFSDSGTIDGIDGAVDQDLFNGNAVQLQDFFRK